MGIPRNDFADAFWKADYRDEDQYRADREYWAEQANYPRPVMPDDVRAEEARYGRWQQQRADWFTLGHAAYLAEYDTVAPPPESYIPARPM